MEQKSAISNIKSILSRIAFLAKLQIQDCSVTTDGKESNCEGIDGIGQLLTLAILIESVPSLYRKLSNEGMSSISKKDNVDYLTVDGDHYEFEKKGDRECIRFHDDEIAYETCISYDDMVTQMLEYPNESNGSGGSGGSNESEGPGGRHKSDIRIQFG